MKKIVIAETEIVRKRSFDFDIIIRFCIEYLGIGRTRNPKISIVCESVKEKLNSARVIW
ncbi:MAG: hypothetical protein ACREBV_07335 [Candidatus Zixiibacteriota bacterium]